MRGIKGLKGFIRKLSSPLRVAGLEFTDSAIKFLDLKMGQTISYRLPPGVIEAGIIKDRKTLINFLLKLRGQAVSSRRRPINVVLTLPINNVYIQTLTLPQIAEENLAEAVDLNLKMSSPIDVIQTYYDWQEILGRDNKNQIEILGAFAYQKVVDDFVGVLEEAGFGTAAVEFSSLSLVRELLAQKIITPTDSYFIVELSPQGLNFILTASSIPTFHYFYPWNLIQGDSRVIALEEFKRNLESEMRRVLNFYATHRSGQKLSEIIFITPVLEEEISSLVQAEFSEFKFKFLKSNEVNAVAGAARRGLAARSEDFEISLANLSARGVFERSQLINFVNVWRNIILTLVGFLLMLFSASNFILRRTAAEASLKEGIRLGEPETAELAELKQKVKEFNRLVALIGEIKSGTRNFYPLVQKVSDLAGPEITLTRFSFSSERPASINGVASSENAAVDFKNRIAALSQFSEVSLPLSSISKTKEGQIFFNLSFKVNNLEF